jgi:hypothetical protein
MFDSTVRLFREYELSLGLHMDAYISLQIAPLLFDTVITFMTIWKAFTIKRRNGGPNSRLIQTFLREGSFPSHVASSLFLVSGCADQEFRCLLLYNDFYCEFG